jgi:hypothetical protein
MDKVHGLKVRPQIEILTLILNGLRNGFFKSFITRFPPKNLYELWGLANGVTKKQRETYEEGDKKNHGNGESNDEQDTSLMDKIWFYLQYY